MRRLKVLPGGRPNDEDPPRRGPDDPVTRGLRELYAAPSEGYWDSLEARVMAAVRASRGAPTAVAEWWHTLADWARPGLAAASLVIGIVGAAAMQSRAAGHAAPRSGEIEPLDADLARALDLVSGDSLSEAEAEAAREAAYLLVDGVYRRQPLPAPARERAPTADGSEGDDVLKARREATFRYVMP